MTSLILAAALLTTQDQGGLASLAQRIEGQSRRESSTRTENGRPVGDTKEHSNWDNFRVGPGETHTLMDRKGPGVITHIWMTFLGPEPQGWAKDGSANHQEMLLRIYWDGSEKPAVEAPVGDFFANSFGKRSEVISVPVVVEDADSYNCFWNMPFRRHARVEIVNQSDKPISLLYYNIDWIKKEEVAEDAPYFYAQYRQEYPVEQGKDYVVLDTEGTGHYVGTVMSVRTRSPSWFGEGDEKIYINGEAEPSIWGTGTEDYFLSAWGLKTTSTPYFGTPYFDQWGIVGGHTSAYRWHINDPIVFQEGIKVSFEHWGWISADENPDYKSTSWNERQDDYSSVAFWYQTGLPSFTARAPEDRKLPSIERITAYARDHIDSHSGLPAELQSLGFYDGPQVLYRPQTDKGEWVEIPFTILEKEPLRLLLNVTTSYDFGIWQAYIVPEGEEPIKLRGAADLYSEKVENKEIHLLDFWPEPGMYTIRLECAGKNPLSKGSYLGLESVRLRERRPRVKEMGWEKDKAWRKDLRLHG